MDTLQTVTFRDYLRIYFWHKPTVIIAFLAIVDAMYFAVLAWPPFYEVQVSLLITA